MQIFRNFSPNGFRGKPSFGEFINNQVREVKIDNSCRILVF
jgi:hypothetical protein